ncbi:MAG: acid phosphatase [Elusimicrobia bacterium]|nr:acid phosphatase [Elusimicrobiota bacterium]
MKPSRPLASALLAASALFPAAARAAGPSFRKVVVVMLENTGYDRAAAQPFLSSLASRGALLTDLSAETHPSQPNYVALVAGSTLGVRSDSPVTLDARHLGDLLEAAGKTWRVYAEDYPGNCFLGAQSGLYVRKHVPFLSFRDVQDDSSRCANVTDASSFASDLQGGSLPDFSLFVPNLDDDGHDTGVAVADQWLSSTFGPLLGAPAFSQDTLLIVTFDEGTRSDNRVYTVLYGAGVAPGSTSDAAYSHYSLLRTIEDGLGLGDLGQGDASAAPVSGVWR